MTKILIAASFGLFFGYLSGYYLDFSAALIKLSLLILFINIFFITKLKADVLLKKVIMSSFVFIIFFIFANMRVVLEKEKNIHLDETVKIDIKIKNITIKDSTKIIEANILNINNDKNNLALEKYKNLRNIAIYTFSQEKYEPDNVLSVEGKLQNSLIIIPKKENETQEIEQNSGTSFDLVKYWNTKNLDAVMMYPKISTSSVLNSGGSEAAATENNSLQILKTEEKKLHTIYYFSYKFRNYFLTSLKKIMNSYDAGIVQAMIWGDASNISKETNNIFRGAGISHILVLSGYNLAIVVALAGFIFQKLSFRKKVFASVLLIVLFLILANTSAPVYRASVMSFYTLLTVLFLRPTNAKFALWFTCFLFFIYDYDTALFDASFHLSFLATMSIIYFYQPILNILKNKYFKNNIEKENKISKISVEKIENNIEKENLFDVKKYKIYENILSIIVVTVSANILISPYLIFQFGYFKFSAILISILISALIPLIMFFGFLSGVFGFFSNIIFLTFGKVFAFLTHALISCISFLAQIGYETTPIIKNPISLFSLFIIYIIIIIFYFYLKFLENKIESQ